MKLVFVLNGEIKKVTEGVSDVEIDGGTFSFIVNGEISSLAKGKADIYLLDDAANTGDYATLDKKSAHLKRDELTELKLAMIELDAKVGA